MTPVARPVARCGYCTKPTEGRTARLLHEDRGSRAVALDHTRCYPLFLDDLMLMSGGVAGALPAAGSCHRCGTWANRARVIAEIESNSGPGALAVRCMACCRTEPVPALTVPLHAYVVADVIT